MIDWVAAEARGLRWDAFDCNAKYIGNVRRVGPYFYVATLSHGSEFSASSLRIAARWLSRVIQG